MNAVIEAASRPLNIIFILIILAYFVWGLLLLAKQGREGTLTPSKKRFVNTAPSILTSIGVLGTFLGIFLGLLSFDVANIDESVPDLLNGLKTAFLSSVTGLFAAIIFRIVQSFGFGETKVSSSAENPMDALVAIASSIEKQTSALVGNEDQSLLSQLKNMRVDLNDNTLETRKTIKKGFQKQVKSFEEFAEKMADNNSQALIEALEKVISDFNQNLTDQFGENFKELNTAVGKLLEWQERYKTHVEEMEQHIGLAVLGITEVRTSIAEISTSASKIPETMVSLEATVNTAGIVIGTVGNMLTTVTEMGERAKLVMPEIEANIEQLTSNLQNAAKSQAKSLEDAADELASSITSNIEKTQQGINNNFETFDEQMQAELQRSLELLGRQLASISEHMTSDYTQFAEAAKRVIEVANA